MNEEITCSEINNSEFRRMRIRTCPFLICLVNGSDLKCKKILGWMKELCRVYIYVPCYYMKWEEYNKYKYSCFSDMYKILHFHLDKKMVALEQVSKAKLCQVFKELNRNIYESEKLRDGLNKVRNKQGQSLLCPLKIYKDVQPYMSPIYDPGSNDETSNGSDKEVNLDAVQILALNRPKCIDMSGQSTNNSNKTTSTTVTRLDPHPNTPRFKFSTIEARVENEPLLEHTPGPRHKGPVSCTITLSQFKESSTSTHSNKRPRSRDGNQETHSSKRARVEPRSPSPSSSERTHTASPFGSDPDNKPSVLINLHINRSLKGISSNTSKRSNRSTPSPQRPQSSNGSQLKIVTHHKEAPSTSSLLNICSTQSEQISNSNQTKNSNGNQSTSSIQHRRLSVIQIPITRKLPPTSQTHTHRLATHTPIIMNQPTSSQSSAGLGVQQRPSVIMTTLRNRISHQTSTLYQRNGHDPKN